MPGGAELGEFGIDVDGDNAEQADVVGLGRGDVGEHVDVEAAALRMRVV